MYAMYHTVLTQGQNYALPNPTFHLHLTYIDVVVLSLRDEAQFRGGNLSDMCVCVSMCVCVCV